MPIDYKETDIVRTEYLKGDPADILQVNQYENGKLSVSAFFEDSKKIRQLNFLHPEVSEIIYEYHQNYSVETALDSEKNILEKVVHINDPFGKYYPYFLSKGIGLVIEQNGNEQLFKIHDKIVYRFRESDLVEIIFDIEGYDESYHLTAEYDKEGRPVRMLKKYLRLDDFPDEVKTYDYFENGVIERFEDDISYTVYNDKKRKIRIGTFRFNEEKEKLYRAYMETMDEEIFPQIMQDIRLETFGYDTFDNQTSYEKSFYRPDFSKDGLTHYLQEYDYFDQYNIECGSFYCKTKEDYDDAMEHRSHLEYLEDRVNEYRHDRLVAVYYIENGKKVRKEFSDEGAETYETYDEYGNTLETCVRNKATGETDHIQLEILYKNK
ncbi:hypothetical protein [Chryseobacterium indologenes]|uniref:Uncharacterized protein n=1 Tax=Chryseobacterium indologenes TaxID=253 RepID=A0A0N0IY09_CHRID|nr:hypothetical protein [Chryseobacterium indologenes]KPE52694.1 hypothetical protein AOB46_01400 [Chryseobacterium indologenes]